MCQNIVQYSYTKTYLVLLVTPWPDVMVSRGKARFNNSRDFDTLIMR